MLRTPTQRDVDAPGYRILEHTADVGLKAWGPTPAWAFAEAAFGEYAIMLGEDPRRRGLAETAEVADIQASGDDWGHLLVSWLAELLFKFETDAFVPVQVVMTECAPPRCRARLGGYVYAPPQGPSGLPIKGVTYHQLRVDVSPGRTELQVVFDV